MRSRLDAPHRELTVREREVSALVVEGLPNRVIAERLGVSPRTIAVHVSRILAKTNCRSRTELAVSITETGVLDSPAQHN
ncbi:MAG: LuxR C-terminal-related transcriptional regulator [Geodermatophilaceae bacterium]